MNREETIRAIRFTNHVHDAFVKPQISVEPAFKLLQEINTQIRLLEMKQRYRGSANLPRDTVYGLSYRAEHLVRVAHNWINPRKLFSGMKPIPFRVLALDVLGTINRGAKLTMDKNTKKLVIDVPSFTLTDRDHEEWEFEDLQVEFTVNGEGLEVAVAGPDFEDSGYCHPHIGGAGSVCMGRSSDGGGDAIISNALKTGDVLGVYVALESLLYTYNPEDPYFSLESLHGETCNECGIRSENMCTCRDCGEYMCSDCHGRCDCGNLHHDGCICLSCTGCCAACGNSVCPDCHRYCDSCDGIICNDCVRVCDDCGDPLCPDCYTICDECNAVLCITCKEANHDDCGNEEKTQEG